MAVLLTGVGLYVVRASGVARELREGREAYAGVCARITESAGGLGSPGTIAHLLAAAEAELARLAERYPRWYAAYQKDPAAHPCEPAEPGTQVGSET